MVMAALYELLTDKTEFHAIMEKLDLPNVKIEYKEVIKCGIKGTHISVVVDGVEEESLDVHTHTHDEQSHTHNHHTHPQHSHHTHDTHSHEHNHPHTHDGKRYGYKDILTLIDGLDLPDNVKDSAISVYKIIGEAEAKVHGVSLDEIHFHEVGSIDAVVDVVCCSLLVDMLGVTDITTSPIHVGFGMVRCEHGVLPVPAPATAEILNGIPMYSGQIEGELCTPTGAALLKHFSDSFGAMPSMKVSKIGYGMGTKDFEAANCLRAFLYESEGKQGEPSPCFQISCNLDDMTPEAIGAAFDVLLENGALDVYTTPIMMKKNRPAVMLSCLCTEESHDDLAKLMIKHTTTLGVRTVKCHRTILSRTTETVQTEYGDIQVKKAQGLGITKQKPEYDDIQKAARKHNVPFQAVYDSVMRES
jgi:hypothetical protein